MNELSYSIKKYINSVDPRSMFTGIGGEHGSPLYYCYCWKARNEILKKLWELSVCGNTYFEYLKFRSAEI